MAKHKPLQIVETWDGNWKIKVVEPNSGRIVEVSEPFRSMEQVEDTMEWLLSGLLRFKSIRTRAVHMLRQERS